MAPSLAPSEATSEVGMSEEDCPDAETKEAEEEDGEGEEEEGADKDKDKDEDKEKPGESGPPELWEAESATADS